ncbi:T9SS type A sorting domain-containing protein [Bacteroidota bacterium]
MKRLIILFTTLFILLLNSNLFAETYEGDLTLTTQAEVDDFNYERVNGTLTINGSITNLNGLSELVYVSGFFYIENTALTNLDGLSNLTFAHHFFIVNNAALINLDGLTSLTTIGTTLTIRWNSALTNLDGLSNLTNVLDLVIDGSPVLTNIDGLSSLTAIRSLFITSTAVTNLDVLSNHSSFNRIYIGGNPNLTNLDGLSNITSVEEFFHIGGSPNLTNLDGLSNLISVGDLIIGSNYSLVNIDGLSNLTSVVNDLIITWNLDLTKFCGLYLLFTNGSVGGVIKLAYNGIEVTVDDIINGDPCIFSPEEQIEDLTDNMEDLVSDGTLNNGNGIALFSVLESALSSMVKGNEKAAIKQLEAFIKQVQAFINSGRLTPEEGQSLIEAANDIIESINNLDKSVAERADEIFIPAEYSLEQNYPNPFNPSTVIRYTLPEATHVKLEVYNPIGQLISDLVNNYMEAGFQETMFNAENLPSGIYIYRLITREFISTKKMILLR